MADEERRREDTRSGAGAGSIIVRLIVTAIILAIASFLTPGFSIVGLWSYIIAAVVITLIDWGVERAMGVDASPFGRGIKGFLIAAVIIYITQFIVPNMSVSMIGALLAALAIGILDAVIPGRSM
ncbi:MAG: phage holin family protein [Clostridium lundense]|nr:phage holin family protein [Clostridium lundense]